MTGEVNVLIAAEADVAARVPLYAGNEEGKRLVVLVLDVLRLEAPG